MYVIYDCSFVFSAIYSGDYYLFESSEEPDPDFDGSPDDSPPHPRDRRSSGMSGLYPVKVLFALRRHDPREFMSENFLAI